MSVFRTTSADCQPRFWCICWHLCQCQKSRECGWLTNGWMKSLLRMPNTCRKEKNHCITTWKFLQIGKVSWQCLDCKRIWTFRNNRMSRLSDISEFLSWIFSELIISTSGDRKFEFFWHENTDAFARAICFLQLDGTLSFSGCMEHGCLISPLLSSMLTVDNFHFQKIFVYFPHTLYHSEQEDFVQMLRLTGSRAKCFHFEDNTKALTKEALQLYAKSAQPGHRLSCDWREIWLSHWTRWLISVTNTNATWWQVRGKGGIPTLF